MKNFLRNKKKSLQNHNQILFFLLVTFVFVVHKDYLLLLSVVMNDYLMINDYLILFYLINFYLLNLNFDQVQDQNQDQNHLDDHVQIYIKHLHDSKSIITIII